MVSEKLELELKFQKAVVKRSIEDAQWYIDNYKYIKPEYFDDVSISNTVEIIYSFFKKHGISPEYSVIKSLSKKTNRKNVHEGICSIVDSISELKIKPSEFIFAESEIKKFATEQHYRNCLIKAVDELEIGNINGVEEQFDKALVFNDEFNSDNIIDVFNDDNFDDKYKNEQTRKIPTLIPTLDEKLRGGVSYKELNLFLAPPYRGKTASLVRMGTNALITGKNVVHITLEMSANKTAIWYDSAITGIPYEDIVKNRNKYKQEINKFKKLHKGNLVIKEFPSRSIGVRELKEEIRSIERKKGWKTDLLVLDYADELKRRDSDNMSYVIGDVISSLRGMGVELNIAIWSASQTNRAGFSKDSLDMDDVADSWDKAKISDVIIGECQSKDEEKADKMRWVVIKARGNKRYSFPIPIRVKFETASFKEI